MSKRLWDVYPGCPPLSFMIAARVTDHFQDADAFISFTGRKGSSKSTSSLSFCEDVALKISQLRGKNEPPEKFFNIGHVKSITEQGALDLLSSGILKNENSVFLLDDTGTQWGARNFQSPINKTLNSILQICRIYKCVIVANFILAQHVDIQARTMADYRAEMQYKNVKEEYAVFKFYYLEQGLKRGAPHEYKKYLRWHGKRITKWKIGKPSEKLENEYKKMRKENTDTYIEAARQKIEVLRDKMAEEASGPKIKVKKMINYDSEPFIKGLKEKVQLILDDPDIAPRSKTATAIARKLGTTRYWVGQTGMFD